MKKIIIQSLVSLTSFLVVLFGFSSVNWMSVFNLHPSILEDKIEKLYWDLFSSHEMFIQDERVTAPLDTLLTRLCEANDIPRETVQLHVISQSEVNAFAFPGGHIVFLSGLLKDSQNEMEVGGVMAHELAHITSGHVMKKLIKELGLSLLSGLSGTDIGALIQVLSSTAYDRSLEAEADRTGTQYMMKAGMDPTYLAEFLQRIESSPDFAKATVWISTHPHGEERAKNIRQLQEEQDITYHQILHNGTWERLKEALK